MVELQTIVREQSWYTIFYIGNNEMRLLIIMIVYHFFIAKNHLEHSTFQTNF